MLSLIQQMEIFIQFCPHSTPLWYNESCFFFFKCKLIWMGKNRRGDSSQTFTKCLLLFLCVLWMLVFMCGGTCVMCVCVYEWNLEIGTWHLPVTSSTLILRQGLSLDPWARQPGWSCQPPCSKDPVWSFPVLQAVYHSTRPAFTRVTSLSAGPLAWQVLCQLNRLFSPITKHFIKEVEDGWRARVGKSVS